MPFWREYVIAAAKCVNAGTFDCCASENAEAVSNEKLQDSRKKGGS